MILGIGGYCCMRDRVCLIDFETDTGIKTVSGLNISFNIVKSFTPSMNKAEISIEGLTNSDIQYLTTINTFQNGMQKRKLIRITAGYDDNASLAFSGEIREATPSVPPARKLSISAYSGLNARLSRLQISKRNVMLNVVAQEIASTIGVNLANNAQDRELSSFFTVGDALDGIRALSSIEGIVSYIEDGTLYVNDEAIFKSKVRLYDKSSGLVGQPKVTRYGCDITVLLDSKLKSGDVFEVRSSTIPLANGLYKATKITHNGESRGNNWYTMLEGRRQ